MLNLLTISQGCIERFSPDKLSRKEHFSSKYKYGNEMPKYVIFLY